MDSNLIYNYVERLSELLRLDSRQAGAEHGLQPVQLEILHYLSICNRYSDTPMAVTEYLGQTKGTVSQTLKVLERKALIVKRADNNDKRIAHLNVSAKGKRLIEKVIPTTLFTNACDSMSDKDQEEISDALRRLLLTLLDVNNMKTFGVCHSCRYNDAAEGGGYFCHLVQQPLSVDDVTLICREHKALSNK